MPKKKPAKKPEIDPRFGDFFELKVEQELLKHRQIMIFSEINQGLAREVIEKLLVLDSLSRDPIMMWINSGGGSVDDGYAIIDVMQQSRSPIITLVVGSACSMAAQISIVGDIRKMTTNSTWMAHDMAGGVWGDYTTKVIDRVEYLEREQYKGEQHLRRHTNLSDKDIAKAKNGELWLYPEKCLQYGIIDEIIVPPTGRNEIRKSAKKKKR